MTDIKRVLAQACDQMTDCILKQGHTDDLKECLRIANECIVGVRENLQDALGRLIQETKQ